jgi:hypothetical protein
MHIKEQLEYRDVFIGDLSEDMQHTLLTTFSEILSDVYSEGYRDGVVSVKTAEYI